MIHFVIIIDFLIVTLKKKYIRVKQKIFNVMPRFRQESSGHLPLFKQFVDRLTHLPCGKASDDSL